MRRRSSSMWRSVSSRFSSISSCVIPATDDVTCGRLYNYWRMVIFMWHIYKTLEMTFDKCDKSCYIKHCAPTNARHHITSNIVWHKWCCANWCYEIFRLCQTKRNFSCSVYLSICPFLLYMWNRGLFTRVWNTRPTSSKSFLCGQKQILHWNIHIKWDFYKAIRKWKAFHWDFVYKIILNGLVNPTLY